MVCNLRQVEDSENRYVFMVLVPDHILLQKILVVEKFYEKREYIHNGKTRKFAPFVPYFEEIP